MNYLVIVMIATVAFFGCGADAQCYNCTLAVMGEMKMGQQGCIEPGFDSTGIAKVPCADKCKIAIMDMAASGGTPAMKSYMRGCHNEGTEGPCTDIDNMEAVAGQKMSQTCCTGALCNNAALIQLSIALILAPLCTLLF